MNLEYLSTIKNICNKRAQDRSTLDIETLYQLTCTNKIFASLPSPNFHKSACRHLKYEFFDSNAYVFLFGSLGLKFYIILQGQVSVEIPQKSKNNLFEEVITLKEGDYFGELALENNNTRQASIRCKTPCHFIYLHKKDYKECFDKFIKDRRNKIVDFLFSLPYFKHFTKGTLTKISYIMKETRFRKSQVIYNENDKSNEIFILVSGEISFFKRIKGNIEKKKPYIGQKTYEMNIANMGKGEIFGEAEIIANEPRFSTCRCTSDDALVYVVDKNVFDN